VLLVVGAAFRHHPDDRRQYMALSIRERTREIGVLKTLGLSGRGSWEWCSANPCCWRCSGGIPGLAIAALIAMALRNSLASIGARVCGIADDHPARPGADDRAGADHGDHSGAQRHAAQNCKPRSDGDRHAFALASSRGVTAINLRSIAQRRWLSLSTVIAIALVVIVAARIPGDGQRFSAHHRRLGAR